MWVALAILLLLIILILVILASAVYIHGQSKNIAMAKKILEELREKEELSRLRHRDLEKFARMLNERRARKGQRGIPMKILERIQYDPRYRI